MDLSNDIGAVELERGQGVMCGIDVDKLIAEIYVGRQREVEPYYKAVHHRHRLPGEPKSEWL